MTVSISNLALCPSLSIVRGSSHLTDRSESSSSTNEEAPKGILLPLEVIAHICRSIDILYMCVFIYHLMMFFENISTPIDDESVLSQLQDLG